VQYLSVVNTNDNGYPCHTGKRLCSFTEKTLKCYKGNFKFVYNDSPKFTITKLNSLKSHRPFTEFCSLSSLHLSRLFRLTAWPVCGFLCINGGPRMWFHIWPDVIAKMMVCCLQHSPNNQSELGVRSYTIQTIRAIMPQKNTTDPKNIATIKCH